MHTIGIALEDLDEDEHLKRSTAILEVIEANRPRLTSFVRRLVEDQAETEDIVQDVYEEFIATYDLGTAVETVSAWLVTVARNKVFDRFRRKRTQRVNREALAHESKTSDPADDWTRPWLRNAIASALELLPPEQRKVFVMHELEGKSFNDIAAETGVGLSTLLSRKKYAVDFLRQYLKEVHDELE